jgi:hypothetical protein
VGDSTGSNSWFFVRDFIFRLQKLSRNSQTIFDSSLAIISKYFFMWLFTVVFDDFFNSNITAIPCIFAMFSRPGPGSKVPRQNCEEEMLTLTVVLYIMSQKDVLPPDVLFRRTFCLYGCFVPTDVLSLRTFCPYGRFVPRTLCLRLFCLRTFCPRTFCP